MNSVNTAILYQLNKTHSKVSKKGKIMFITRRILFIIIIIIIIINNNNYYYWFILDHAQRTIAYWCKRQRKKPQNILTKQNIIR